MAEQDKPVKRKRRKMNLTDAERARRSEHIAKFSHLGAAASAKRPKDEIRKIASIGGKQRSLQYKVMKEAMTPESSAELRKRRKEHEASREEILKSLVEAARDPDAKTETISAALRELRAESDRLLAREKAAMDAERAAGKPVGLPPVSSTDNSPADSAPVSPSLAAD